MTKKDYWKRLNKPIWTPIGLCGWIALVMTYVNDNILWIIFWSAIMVFSITCFFIRESKKENLKN